jgi:GT2 family glycosyltransferase
MTVRSDHVTVIIPAGNAPDVRRAVASVVGQQGSERIAEVVVVGGGWNGDAELPVPVRLIRTTRPVTSPVARNIGIHAADTDWLGFLDADCVASPDWLNNLTGAADAAHRVVGGGVAFGQVSYWGSVHNVSMLHDFHVSALAGPRELLPTLNLLVHRSVIELVGVMNEQLRRAQDLEWTVRMRNQGIGLWFEPRARVTHFPARGSRSLWQDYHETGATSVRVRRGSANLDGIPAWIKSRRLLRCLSPGIAAIATFRIFARNKSLAPYVFVAPGVWYTKFAWCFGAAERLAERGVA